MQTTTRITVDWADIDAMRHVNSLAILRYIQTARVNICRAAGLMPEFVAPKEGPILASISVQYRRPLFFPGEAVIESRVTDCRTTSFTLAHTVLDGEGNLAAEETEVLVYYDYEAGCKKTLPAAFVGAAKADGAGDEAARDAGSL